MVRLICNLFCSVIFFIGFKLGLGLIFNDIKATTTQDKKINSTVVVNVTFKHFLKGDTVPIKFECGKKYSVSKILQVTSLQYLEKIDQDTKGESKLKIDNFINPESHFKGFEKEEAKYLDIDAHNPTQWYLYLGIGRGEFKKGYSNNKIFVFEENIEKQKSFILSYVNHKIVLNKDGLMKVFWNDKLSGQQKNFYPELRSTNKDDSGFRNIKLQIGIFNINRKGFLNLFPTITEEGKNGYKNLGLLHENNKGTVFIPKELSISKLIDKYYELKNNKEQNNNSSFIYLLLPSVIISIASSLSSFFKSYKSSTKNSSENSNENEVLPSNEQKNDSKRVWVDIF